MGTGLRVGSVVLSDAALMEKKKIDSPNGKERRSGPDRRKGDRRDSKQKTGRGVLTTRVTDRRKKSRRKGFA
jgi:hypothetical protein